MAQRGGREAIKCISVAIEIQAFLIINTWIEPFYQPLQWAKVWGKAMPLVCMERGGPIWHRPYGIGSSR